MTDKSPIQVILPVGHFKLISGQDDATVFTPFTAGAGTKSSGTCDGLLYHVECDAAKPVPVLLPTGFHRW